MHPAAGTAMGGCSTMSGRDAGDAGLWAQVRRRREELGREVHARPFLSPFGPISDHFRPRRHRLPASEYHQLLQSRFAAWRAVTGLPAAA
jgi:hypothetical protein